MGTPAFFDANPIDRCAVSSPMPYMRNADGSLDRYLQKDSPCTNKKANRLPVPAGDFDVTMRMYRDGA
jgi:hypothetical protein